MSVIDQRIVNLFALVLLGIFVFQCGYDVFSVDFEVSTAMYTFMATISTGVLGIAGTVAVLKKRPPGAEEEKSEPPKPPTTYAEPVPDDEIPLMPEHWKNKPLKEIFKEDE